MQILIPYKALLTSSNIKASELYHFSENMSRKKLLEVTLKNYFRLIKAQIASVYVNWKLNFEKVMSPDSRAGKVRSLQISLFELILRENILKRARRGFAANLPQPAAPGLNNDPTTKMCFRLFVQIVKPPYMYKFKLVI